MDFYYGFLLWISTLASSMKDMANSPQKTVQIKRGRIKNLLDGHPWIFSGAIESTDASNDGELVRIFSGKRFLGIGYYHSKTDIAVRVITSHDCNIDVQFFTKRFQLLRSRKEQLLNNDTNCYRFAFAEADGLPGHRRGRPGGARGHTADRPRPRATALGSERTQGQAALWKEAIYPSGQGKV